MTLAIRGLAPAVGRLAGWRRRAAAFACGVCATLTLAPFYYFPLIVVAYGGLYMLLDSAATRKRAFWDGWWWGWGFYITGLYWFCIALLTDPEKFAWLIPFALFALTGVIAIYSGMACWLMSYVKQRGVARVFIFALVWTGVECARGHLFTGFPWNLPGYSFGFSDSTLQMASVVGIYGLTFFTVLLGASPVLMLESTRPNRMLVVAAWGVFTLGLLLGHWRLQEANRIPEAERYVPDVMLRLVQANISQPHKWDPKLQLKGLQQYISMTQQPGLNKATHVIWPETATPYVIKTGMPLTRLLGDSVPAGSVLITGALRAAGDGDRLQMWNSVVAIDHEGGITGSYDKHQLVPFGEFLPFRRVFPKSWLTPVGDLDFSRGPGPRTLEWPNLPPVSPLICYEAIFPEATVGTEMRPQWLLNVTNDAWFGLSSGPYQHFNMARMRAVEQGLPLVRVANTGITAVIDPWGRVLQSIPLGTQGILDVKLPKSLNGTTLYSNHSYLFLLFLAVCATLLIVRQLKTDIN